MVVEGWKGTITPGGHCSARLVPSPHVIVHSQAPSGIEISETNSGQPSDLTAQASSLICAEGSTWRDSRASSHEGPEEPATQRAIVHGLRFTLPSYGGMKSPVCCAHTALRLHTV